MTIKYKASLDLLAIVITLLVLGLFIFIGQFSVKGLLSAKGDISVIIIQALVLFFLAATFFGCWFFAPSSYSVNDRFLIINRPVGNIKFPISSIKTIQQLNPGEMKAVIRTFGVGGLFGYYGNHYSSKFGNVIFYATRLNRKVLIETREGKKIIITPDDDALVVHLKQLLEKIS